MRAAQRSSFFFLRVGDDKEGGGLVETGPLRCLQMNVVFCVVGEHQYSWTDLKLTEVGLRRAAEPNLRYVRIIQADRS